MNDISHFQVLADDLPRAQRFYGTVFGWKFEAWGPPDFFLVTTSDNPDRLRGAMYRRYEPLATEEIRCFECTITVDDVDRVAKDVVANGGTIVYEKSVIQGVGEVIRFKDTEGNFVCAMKYTE